MGKTKNCNHKTRCSYKRDRSRKRFNHKGSQAHQASQTAKLEADSIVAQADRDYKMKLAEYNAAIKQKEAEATLLTTYKDLKQNN